MVKDVFSGGDSGLTIHEATSCSTGIQIYNTE